MRTAEVHNPHAPDIQSVLKTIARWILAVEPIWLACTLFAFWYPSPARDHWMFLLVGLPITIAARFVLYRRLWTRFPLDIVFVTLLALMALNLRFAPYSRGLIMFGRPLLGISLCLYVADYARLHGKLDGVLIATLLLALLVAFLALTGSQWNSKSDQLRFITDALPRFTQFPAAEGGFNANEIAGALAWLTPLLAGLILYSTKRWWRWLFGATFGLLLAALFLGQSRFALAGTLLSLALMTPFIIKQWRWRALAWAGIVAIVVLEIMIVRNVFSPAKLTEQVERDEDSLTGRFDIWKSALDIIHDYPLTGVGLNNFRNDEVRQRYPVTTFKQPILPHTHNELLQFGTDMGLPGLALFGLFYGVAGWMLVQGYRRGDRQSQIIAAAAGAGLLAHAVFGLGDAITTWDRFAFIWWWLLALAGGQFVLSSVRFFPVKSHAS